MKRKLFGGVALCLILAATSYGAQQESAVVLAVNPRTITIRIHNYAQVKPTVLLPAKKTAAEILKKAGVETIWVECYSGQASLSDAECAHPMTPLDLTLNLLPQSQTKHFHSRDEILGVALLPGGEDFGFYAYVFCGGAKAYAAHHELDLSRLLGHVIAHELGHLLLGANSHSGTGIMQPCWNVNDLIAIGHGGMSFSFSEKKKLQMALAVRTRGILSDELSP
jgi:hypothetical protein